MFLRPFIAGYAACLMTIAAIGLLASAFADTWVGVNCCAYHTERPTRFNENNLGFGVEHDIAKDWRAVGGFCKNSVYKETVYGGVMWNALTLGYLRLNLMGGLFTGYNDSVIPVIAPIISLEGKRVGLNLLALPPIGQHQGVFGLQFKVKFP